MGPQGQRPRSGSHEPQADPWPDSLLSLQPDRVGVYIGRAQVDRGMGSKERHLDHLRRDLSPDKLWSWTGTITARFARRTAGTDRHYLRRQQSVRDDWMADWRSIGTAARDQGHGRPSIAYHDRGQPPRAVGRCGSVF